MQRLGIGGALLSWAMPDALKRALASGRPVIAVVAGIVQAVKPADVASVFDSVRALIHAASVLFCHISSNKLLHLQRWHIHVHTTSSGRGRLQNTHFVVGS